MRLAIIIKKCMVCRERLASQPDISVKNRDTDPSDHYKTLHLHKSQCGNSIYGPTFLANAT